METKEYVVKYLEDKTFQKTFPEFEKQYAYYNNLMEKKKSGKGCSSCTLNKIRAAENEVYAKVISNSGYYSRFETFLLNHDEEMPDAKDTPKNKPKVNDEYVQIKNAVAKNFSRLPISKTRFTILLKKDKYRDFVLQHRELQELTNSFLHKFKTGKDLTQEVKSQIDILYDLIYSNNDILIEFKEMHEGEQNINSSGEMEAPVTRYNKLEVIESNSLEELKTKLSDFIQNTITPVVSISKVGKKYLGTITYR